MPSESSSAQSIFQFTLGPVQGFVSQARRTRDFWAGSFILSWLSGVAMACIKEQGGNIEFPLPDDDYLSWLTTGTGEKRPQQGSIPNRFKAVQATVPRDFHPEWVSEAVRGAWRALAETVWQGDLEGRVGDATRVIWERQINQFWELSWVLSEQEEGNLLDRRKNWRSSVAPAEPGHKCMMMDGWQELSGVLKTNMGDVNAFWKKLRASGKKGMQTDLRDSEHLCALAFVKRRFARYFESVNYAMPDGKTRIFGWKVPSSVPSTSFLAAAPWIAEAIEKHHTPLPRFTRKRKNSAHTVKPTTSAENLNLRWILAASVRRPTRKPLTNSVVYGRGWMGSCTFQQCCKTPNNTPTSSRLIALFGR